MNTAVYIIINFLLFPSWFAFLFHKRGILSFSDRIIAAFVLGLTQIIATEMLLGVVFKKLYAGPLFIANITISAAVLSSAVLLGNKSESDMTAVFFPDIVKEIKDRFTGIYQLLRGDRILCLLFLLFAAFVFRAVFSGYLFPSYTWDALWYHLPIVGHIMQSGAIQEIPVNSFIDQFINIFPKNIELFFLWNTIFLQDDVIADLSQLIFALAGVLTVYSIAVKLGISRKHAVYSSLLFFFTPVMILQSTTNYVDVAVAVLFLVAINFLTNDPITAPLGNTAGGTFSSRENIRVFLAGLSAGILLGSKGSGPLFIIVLSVFLIAGEFIKRAPGGRSLSNMPAVLTGSLRVYIVFFLMPAVVTGGYWYVKNWIIYHNPVYPMELSILNINIFKGLYNGMIEPVPEIISRLSYMTRPLYVWSENIKHYLYDSRLGGLGPIWFVLFLPGLVFSIAYSLHRKNNGFLAVSMIIVLTFLIYPRNWTPRYVIYIVGLGALSFGMVLDYFSMRGKILKITALMFAVYTFFTANSPIVTAGQIKKMMDLPAKERTIGRYAPFNLDMHAAQEYGHWIWISRNIAAGDTLAYTFEPLFHSPLWSRGFSNRIIFIRSASYQEWLQKLLDNNVTHVLVRKHSGEDQWVVKENEISSVTGQEERFRVVYSDENYKIFRFIRLLTARRTEELKF